ncbi:MAG TPA: growth/differentiation factor [Coriobacteriia bacterium]|nr:growth/differentiation factor [Coriobacteriia bacterium]
MEALVFDFLGGMDITSTISAIFASGDEDGAGLALLLLMSGPAFFMFTYLRYRNTDKRHGHEHETPAEMNNLQQYDNLVKRLTRQDSSRISGANEDAVTGSLASNQGIAGSDMAKSILKSFKG